MIVRLKGNKNFDYSYLTTVFQFYDSPIKRETVDGTVKWMYSFNSMIVRLKVRLLEAKRKGNYCFNSMIVRLKAQVFGRRKQKEQVSIL